MTPHDLRRTAATIMGRLDIDQMTIARVLNHAGTTKQTVTGSVYDRHTYLPRKRRALEALDAELHRIVTGVAPTANLVLMRGGAPWCWATMARPGYGTSQRPSLRRSLHDHPEAVSFQGAGVLFRRPAQGRLHTAAGNGGRS
jgi:hypothetical protein